jgi:hypothetical protein
MLIGGVENNRPAIDRNVAKRGLDLVHVVADPGRAPHVVDGIFIAGIVFAETLHDVGPHVGEVRQLGLVELLEDACLDLAGEERPGRHHDVIARTAREQLGLQHFIGVEDVIDDLDTGFLGEVLEDGIVDVVGPVVDVDHALLGTRGAGRKKHGRHGCSQPN